MDEQSPTFADSRTRWQHVHISNAELARHQHEYMMLAFDALYLRAKQPHGMTLWMTRRRETGVDAYISPTGVAHASAWLKRYQAADSPAPDEPVVLVAGHHYQPGPSVRRRPTPSQPLPRYRRYLPVGYNCRSIRQFEHARPYEWWFQDPLDAAPFVRRFARAWNLNPGRAREDFRVYAVPAVTPLSTPEGHPR